MHLGPNVKLVSNDRFVNITVDLKQETDISELFSIWAMNQVIGYSLPLQIHVNRPTASRFNFLTLELAYVLQFVELLARIKVLSLHDPPTHIYCEKEAFLLDALGCCMLEE